MTEDGDDKFAVIIDAWSLDNTGYLGPNFGTPFAATTTKTKRSPELEDGEEREISHPAHKRLRTDGDEAEKQESTFQGNEDFIAFDLEDEKDGNGAEAADNNRSSREQRRVDDRRRNIDVIDLMDLETPWWNENLFRKHRNKPVILQYVSNDINNLLIIFHLHTLSHTHPTN